MRIIDVVGDSRARNLSLPLRNRYPGVRHVSAMPGAEIDRLSTEVRRRVLALSPPDAVLLVGGICSVTERDPVSHYISLRIPSTHYAVLDIMPRFEDLMAVCYAANPTVKVILCNLFGVDLRRANYQPVYPPHHYQNCVNTTVRQLNHRLTQLNTLYQVITPQTDLICHYPNPNNCNMMVDEYSGLYDGCHMSADAALYGAELIGQCLEENENWGLI